MIVHNEYMSYPVILEGIQPESFDIKTFRVRFAERKIAESFHFRQGQFVEISVPGAGEAPMSIASPPSRRDSLDFTMRDAGKVTHAIHRLKVRDILYLRGPYGNSFPIEAVKGKNILFVAGGIGLAPLRGLIYLVFENRQAFKHIKILYGAKTPDEICFKEEIKRWREIPDTEILLTVDRACDGWDGYVGVVTELWQETSIPSENAVAFVCGPPMMMKRVARKLNEAGFKDNEIIMTIERYMKCGIGKCGHCNVGEKFVCIDGPVFTYEEIKNFSQKENVL